MWGQWVIIIAGIWVIISGYLFEGAALIANLWITGIIIIALGIWGASMASKMMK
ncbi:MAG: hypothetical protein Q7S37_03240 [bacterium]|nr:hypothetical protein [bacterium]